MTAVPPWFTAAYVGTSFFGGRLAGDLVERLSGALPEQPEAIGPVKVYNFGRGGFTSSQIRVTTIPAVCLVRPNHVYYDTGAINSSVDFGTGPAVDRAQHILDIQQSVAALQAAIPGVRITLLTMSSVSATVATIRPAYADYNADVVAQAALLGLDCEDLYANWPKPLDPQLTYGAGAFAIAPTATFLAMPDGTGWNAADKAADIVLTHVDAGIAIGVAGQAAARANTALSGKRHFEHRIDMKVGTLPGVGLANGAAALTSMGGDNNSMGIAMDGNVYLNGANVGGAGFVPAAGDVLGVEVDTAAKLAYFMKGAARSAGFSFAALGAGPIYPFATLSGKGMGILSRFTPSGDGLHALFDGALAIHSYPQLLAKARSDMSDHFGL